MARVGSRRPGQGWPTQCAAPSAPSARLASSRPAVARSGSCGGGSGGGSSGQWAAVIIALQLGLPQRQLHPSQSWPVCGGQSAVPRFSLPPDSAPIQHAPLPPPPRCAGAHSSVTRPSSSHVTPGQRHAQLDSEPGPPSQRQPPSAFEAFCGSSSGRSTSSAATSAYGDGACHWRRDCGSLAAHRCRCLCCRRRGQHHCVGRAAAACRLPPPHGMHVHTPAGSQATGSVALLEVLLRAESTTVV
jgi:hypothetical protein